MKKAIETLKTILFILVVLLGILYVIMVPIGCLVYAFINGGLM